MGASVGTMMLAMFVCFAVLLAAIGAAVYFGARAARRIEGGVDNVARELLDRRLAAGEITPEDYFERESALRDAAPVGGR